MQFQDAVVAQKQQKQKPTLIVSFTNARFVMMCVTWLIYVSIFRKWIRGTYSIHGLSCSHYVWCLSFREKYAYFLISSIQLAYFCLSISRIRFV